MLTDDRLFQQLMTDDEVMLSISPQLFFQILLLRARRDLEQELYTTEHRHKQKVVLFDASQVVDLLEHPEVLDYLARMLASFTRINSVTIPCRVRPGIWRRLRVNDLDVDSLLAYAATVEGAGRYRVYQRIGDACLFLAGIFPEYVEARTRYPVSGQPRLRHRGSMMHSLEDYESYGRAFYRLAAEQEMARQQGVDDVLSTLAEHFVLAEKPLAFLAERYLALRKHRLFAASSPAKE
jgi:hypothetical protein